MVSALRAEDSMATNRTAQDVVVVAMARTPVGTYQGSLRDVPAHELGALVIRTALERAALEPSAVDEVVMGQVGQVGRDAYNARRCAIGAGIPASSTAVTVNRLCGSGLQAVWSGVQQIQLGIADVVVAGGDESMSRQPFLDFDARAGKRLGDRVLVDGTLSLLTDPFAGYQMGETAERVSDRFGVDRAAQDAFAVESHRRAIVAIEEGRFRDAIVPVPLRDGTTFEVDEHPRRDATAERLAKLRPVFRPEGTVTAGNASGINDGAAAVVLMSATDAAAHGAKAVLRFVDAAVAGIEPDIMGYAPVPAVRKLLGRTGCSIDDIEVIELNEAFAAQSVPVIRDLGLDPDRVNPNGGAIALGHPIGATGGILLVKLAGELARREARLGMVTMCIGGGQGIAALFERPA
jgi:acetyl-CoA C-acetyltransferase